MKKPWMLGAGACAAVALQLLVVSGSAFADEVSFSIGGGPQPETRQNNRWLVVDYSFYTLEQSERRHLQVGVAYTRVTTNTPTDSGFWAFSVYPQLTLFPTPGAKIRARAPKWGEPYFYARALGPSYISANRLGKRQQAHNFSFMAAIGAGFLIDTHNGRQANINVSWRHFSNASIFSKNDGFDAPFVITYGIRF